MFTKVSDRSKRIVQRALQLQNYENPVFSANIPSSEHSSQIASVTPPQAELQRFHVTAESEIFSSPDVSFENRNNVQSWIDSQPHNYDMTNTLQTLGNVKDASSDAENQIPADTQVPRFTDNSYLTDNYDTAKILQTLENVKYGDAENQILADTQVPHFTDNFDIEKDMLGLDNSSDDDGSVRDDDDSVRDKDFSPTSSTDSSSDEEYHRFDDKTQIDDDNDNTNEICTKRKEKKNPNEKEANEHDKRNQQEEQNKIQEQEETEVQEEEDNVIPDLRSNSRKRLRRPETWKRNLKKKKVNSGESYISEGKRQIPAKKIKASCKENCRFKCFTIIDKEMREALFNNFWKLGDNNLQRQFAASHMELVKPKYRRITEGSTRGENVGYFFTINGERRRVCKLFFMNTLNVGDRFVRTSWAKAKECNIVKKDKRGNHNRHKKLDESIKDSVRDHINSFQAIESHYLRANTTRKFIDGSLTLAQMYRYYKQERQERNLPIAKRCTYETIFNREFNISFYQPKKDQCSICETYKNSSPEEKEKSQENYDRHIANKIKSREEKSKDTAIAKDNLNVIVACFDLQAVLPTPCGDVSAFYYKCRLNCFNFTIYEIASKRGLCYFWHEAIASRGANEIATCLFSYISSLPPNSDIIFYSDNCVGQNKNKIVVSMYLYAVCNTEVKSIVHKFLTVGHTQNEGDSMHSVIERQKKRVLKSGPIFVPSQWPPLIRTAIKEGKPYEVKELATEEFFNFKEIANQFGQKFTKNSKNEKVIWNEIQELKIGKQSPYKVFYKINFEDEYKEIDLSSRRTQSLKNSSLTNAYDTPPSLKEKNKEHLLDLCKKNLIEKVHQPFYFNICS